MEHTFAISGLCLCIVVAYVGMSCVGLYYYYYRHRRGEYKSVERRRRTRTKWYTTMKSHLVENVEEGYNVEGEGEEDAR